MNINPILADPNNSIPIIKDAIGVFVAPANTPIIPSPAKNSIGSPIILASKFPKVAPITNNGVTSPPWNPTASVSDVKTSFIINAPLGTGWLNALLNKSKLNPR
ncbi:hypothetical protein Q5M85_07800 [Paraclostridium bifermentans]|nr:hypothetical protein [Paraclostridium bifermentans]